MQQLIGKYLILIGGFIILAGIFLLAGSSDKLSWLGNLPGDIKIEKNGFRFYFPLTTSILLSVLFSLILWIMRKLF